jgi:hypothetical protein
MSETKWTPGPWHVGPTDDTQVTASDGTEIARMDGDYDDDDVWPMMEANARVVSALPEFHEVLKAYEAWEASLILEGNWSNGLPKMTREQFDRLLEIQDMRNVAFAKADGQK